MIYVIVCRVFFFKSYFFDFKAFQICCNVKNYMLYKDFKSNKIFMNDISEKKIFYIIFTLMFDEISFFASAYYIKIDEKSRKSDYIYKKNYFKNI